MVDQTILLLEKRISEAENLTDKQKGLLILQLMLIDRRNQMVENAKYGHIHESRDSRPFECYKAEMEKRNIPYECYNVGCMLHNYKPVTLNQLRNNKLK